MLDEAKMLRVEERDWDEASITRGTKRFLNKVSQNQEWLFEELTQAIPPSVKNVLNQESWTPDDLLSLPRISLQERRPGVYLDLLTGPAGDDETHAGYTGSATRQPQGRRRCGLGARIVEHHKSYASEAKSAHHKQAKKPGWKMNFRLLARFEISVAAVYAILMESIMMVFLGTYKSKRHMWNPQHTIEMARKLRPSHLFPDVNKSYKALSRALPLRQGLKKDNRLKTCANCQETETPESK